MSKFRNIFVRLYDVLWREPKLIWKYYMPWCCSGQGAGGKGQEITSPQVGTGRALSAATDSQAVSPSLGGGKGEAQEKSERATKEREEKHAGRRR